MKRIGFLFVLIISLIACSNDNDSTTPEKVVTDYYGKWVHTKNTATWNMSYQFNKDNTVIKTLIYENGTRTIIGTFEIKHTAMITTFVITYPKSDMLISNCSDTLNENLILTDSGNLNDSAGMCDRYGEYKKVQ